MVSDRLHIGLWLYRCCHDHLENEPADRARQLCTTQKAHQEHDARLPVRFTSSNRIVLAPWTQPSKHGYNHCARCLQHWLLGSLSSRTRGADQTANQNTWSVGHARVLVDVLMPPYLKLVEATAQGTITIAGAENGSMIDWLALCR